MNIDQIQPDLHPEIPRKKSKLKFVVKFFFSLFFLLVLAVLFVVPDKNVNPTQKQNSSWFSRLPIIGQASHLVESATQPLKGEDSDRINILLLGIGGKGHDGAYLTDTIMVASVKPSLKKVSLISIPRDLTVPIEGAGWRKVNNIDAYAEKQDPGSGGLATSQALADIFNIPIDYYVRFDFDGFKKMIDDLGGIKVNVANTLNDYNYPIIGMEDAEPYSSRYKHLHVDAGWQNMDGDLALSFVRSRHGINGEGSDFARSRRQQEVIAAIKDKVISTNMLLNPVKIGTMVSDLAEHLSTNLQIWEIFKFWNILKDVNNDNILNKVVDNGPGGLLVDGRGQDGAYILTTKSGDFSELQYMFSNIFNTAPQIETNNVLEEKADIEVYNGTWVNGLASQKALDLEKYGFNVIHIANASQHNFQKSVIYDLTLGKKTKSLAVLKDKTQANIAYGLPQWLSDDLVKNSGNQNNPSQADFILIIGEEADSTKSGTQNKNN